MGNYTYAQKVAYDDKLYEDFKEDTIKNVKIMCLEAYNLALQDPNFEKDYTYLVLETIKDLAAKKDVNKISFKQWKCLRAYVRNNIKPDSIEDFLKS